MSLVKLPLVERNSRGGELTTFSLRYGALRRHHETPLVDLVSGCVELRHCAIGERTDTSLLHVLRIHTRLDARTGCVENGSYSVTQHGTLLETALVYHVIIIILLNQHTVSQLIFHNLLSPWRTVDPFSLKFRFARNRIGNAVPVPNIVREHPLKQ